MSRKKWHLWGNSLCGCPMIVRTDIITGARVKNHLHELEVVDIETNL